jgi:CheY-like chemotaxis protein
MVAERVLQNNGYETMAALNGRDGLEKANEWKPDIILLDIVMPEMNGYEVAQKLRQSPETTRIPVVFLSAKGDVDEKQGASAGLKEIDQAFDSGANDFLHKPVAASDLLQTISDVLSLNELLSNV